MKKTTLPVFNIYPQKNYGPKIWFDMRTEKCKAIHCKHLKYQDGSDDKDGVEIKRDDKQIQESTP